MATNNNILRYMNLDYSDNKIMKDRAKGGSDGDHRIAGGSDGDHRIAGAHRNKEFWTMLCSEVIRIFIKATASWTI